jgi:tetratricopeptide (TPR) repeat protein
MAARDPRAVFDAALDAHRAGDLAAAERGYAEVLERLPDQPDALHLMGLVRLSRGAAGESEALIRRSLARSGNVAEVWNSLGNALSAQEKREDAAAAFGKALAINPRLVGALVNLGLLKKAVGQPAEAEKLWRQALAEDPRSAEAWANLGGLLYRDNRWGECVDAFERAAALAPRSALYANNLGMAYRTVGRVDEALACQERAAALDPALEDARLAVAMVHLSLGGWSKGWPAYLARRTPHHVETLTRTPLPRDLSGRRFLVRRNQGLGDELFFLRFVPDLRRRGAARIAYECDPRIAAMLERAGLADEIRPEPARLDGDETAMSVGDLPFLLGMSDGDAVPPSIRLEAEPARRATIRERLRAAGPGPYLGVTWRAGTDGWLGILHKEVPLAALASVIRNRPGTLVALQRGPAAGEVADLARMSGRPVADFTADNESLEDMLAIVSEVEAYVAVSNTNVHLRAAVSLPTHVLVARPPDWRWMDAGERSPWFPDCPLYRQQSDSSWDDALAALRAAVGSR